MLWSGGAVSLLGTQMSTVAYPLAVLALTGSATLAGVVGTTGLVARLVLRLPAGALVDRWDRRHAMLVADLSRVAVLASVAAAAAFGVLGVAQLAVAAFVENGFGELFRPASIAAFRRVVRPAEMATAVSRLEARSYAAGVAGPPLGGVLFGLARSLPFAGDAASYAYSFLATLVVRTPMGVTPATQHENLRGQLTAGLGWVWGQRVIRAMLLSAAGFGFVFRAVYLAVIVAARAGGANPAQVGTMLGTAGACGFAGALLATRLAGTRHPSLVVLGIFWSTTALVSLMALTHDPYLLGVLLGTTTFLAPAANTILISYVITVTPDALQGRVDAAGNFVTGAASPLAPLAVGLLLTKIGGPGTFLAIGGITAAIAMAVTAAPAMRSIPRLSELTGS